jgi:hypothetical protein
VKPTPKAVNKPSPHFIVHGLDKPGGFTTVSENWLISQDYDEAVIRLVENQGGQVSDKRPQVAPAAVVPRPLQDACVLLCVTPDAPLSVAEAAFKALARIHHPDVGGDTQTMQRLNDALATFKSFTEVPF